MELDAVEAKLLEKRQFLIERQRFAYVGTERIRAFMNVPRAKCESKRASHENLLCFVLVKTCGNDLPVLKTSITLKP